MIRQNDNKRELEIYSILPDLPSTPHLHLPLSLPLLFPRHQKVMNWKGKWNVACTGRQPEQPASGVKSTQKISSEKKNIYVVYIWTL